MKLMAVISVCLLTSIQAMAVSWPTTEAKVSYTKKALTSVLEENSHIATKRHLILIEDSINLIPVQQKMEAALAFIFKEQKSELYRVEFSVVDTASGQTHSGYVFLEVGSRLPGILYNSSTRVFSEERTEDGKINQIIMQIQRQDTMDAGDGYENVHLKNLVLKAEPETEYE